MQLTRGMYESDRLVDSSNLFNLRGGQVRQSPYAYNRGWYNKAGEKLGWGDLSKADFRNIAAELDPGELFIILPKSDMGNLDIGFLIQHATYVIARGQIFVIDHFGQRQDEEEQKGHMLGKVIHIHRERFRFMLTAP